MSTTQVNALELPLVDLWPEVTQTAFDSARVAVFYKKINRAAKATAVRPNTDDYALSC